MVFQGAELASRVDEILYKYKLLLRKKGMMSVRGLRTWFRHVSGNLPPIKHVSDLVGHSLTLPYPPCSLQIDEDKSKRIEQIELEQALNREGIFPSRDEMQALMAWFDTNGDGGINLDEFITGLADKLEELRAVFEKIRNKLMLISDRDGKLSAFEMQQAILKLGIAVDKKLMEAVHKDFDNDGDGQVDYREFARFVCDYGGGL
uniref:EF-hand domain-containing protein n=1 Tax=Chromera velia CCMP2878 TaxID=1169474 RepID=A0A0G4GTY7_9ALVE|eukprot:Cvel_756.t1-p1 / transcript=Cvel_756.t1 / gene=Cvel_756 / organism=Chromera_velia_CCMP2878 / gene_product=Probable calcium-binding protein CML11, putative / transcript_product=Probable calcium-binding protein CML11, putative / location=Cvel_scaffold23:123144-129806(+) / protein_length=203 / sequence_SO=supercontig / SO=protein_coding / is_pseudo=false